MMTSYSQEPVHKHACHELGLCQGRTPPCHTCPQRRAKPVAATPLRMGFYPGAATIEGPYRRSRLRRMLRTLWAYIKGPFSW